MLDVDGKRYPILKGRTVIGRGSEADVTLDDTGASRRHAEVQWDGSRARVRDLGSTNGTQLNGAPGEGGRRSNRTPSSPSAARASCSACSPRPRALRAPAVAPTPPPSATTWAGSGGRRMSELTLLVLQLGFLLLLWVFIFAIVYALRSDLFGQRVRKLQAECRGRPGRRSRGLRVPERRPRRRPRPLTAPVGGAGRGIRGRDGEPPRPRTRPVSSSRAARRRAPSSRSAATRSRSAGRATRPSSSATTTPRPTTPDSCCGTAGG